jgi:hypothetical protein
MPLITAALVAATLAVGSTILDTLGVILALASGVGPLDIVGHNLPAFVGGMFDEVVRYVLFGAGVFISLRFIAAIGAADGWRRVIVRGVVAAAIGAAVITVVVSIEGFLGAATLGDHPFGYAFEPGFNSQQFGQGILNGLSAGAAAFVDWVPLVVLAGILQKLWLARHPGAAATGPASPAGTL